MADLMNNEQKTLPVDDFGSLNPFLLIMQMREKQARKKRNPIGCDQGNKRNGAYFLEPQLNPHSKCQFVSLVISGFCQKTLSGLLFFFKLIT